MTQETQHPKTKSAYQRPLIKRIELKAEEVLAIGCKTGTTSGPASGPPCGFGTSCALPNTS
jgi:hypothetical protein